MSRQRPPEAPTVLVCDYVGRRAQAPVVSLDLQSHGYRVLDLIAPPLVRETTAVAYGEALLRRSGPFGADVCAVLAYCASAPIAQELVASLASSTGMAVPLVVFDAEQSNPSSIEEQYLVAGVNLGEVLGLPVPDRLPTRRWDARMLQEQPDEVLRRMHEGLLALGVRAVELGTDDPEAAHEDAAAVGGFYLDWFAHLIASHNASWSPWRGRSVQIVSEDHPVWADWPGAAATEPIRVAATRDELLRHPDVEAAVLRVLREGVHRAG